METYPKMVFIALKWEGHNKDRCPQHMVKVSTRVECLQLRGLKEVFQARVRKQCQTNYLKCKDKVQWELPLEFPCMVKGLNLVQF